MKRFQRMFFWVIPILIITTRSLWAAPIGVPGATLGTNKSAIGPELNFVLDRDLAGGGEVESVQAYAKGEIGLTDRVDLNLRVGFGDFEIKNGNQKINTDTGPAFGVGFKVTWAAISNTNLKIGSVFQTVRLRAEENNNRRGWSEYDAALGLYYDAGSQSPRAGEAVLVPYGGVAWSGLDLTGSPAEEKTFGVFMGLLAKIGGNFHVGLELRFPEQTSLGLQALFTY
ncbi:MAG: hypothetical protein WAO55_11055 [Candidatus Manganitrophaceae bacterium]